MTETMLDTVPETSDQIELYRGELTGYCYRMLGSPFDAEDAVQETLIRAWRGIDRLEDRAALRSWLYRIATHVCLDAIDGRGRRALPVDLGPAGPPEATHLSTLPETSWIEPIPDDRVLSELSDPAEVAATRESIRLALVAALQHLPPRQRAVLVLCEVLRWSAAETAELLETSVPAVNSALQRARATLATLDLSDGEPLEPLDDDQQALLERYASAFERYDMEALRALLHEDATQSMPPYELWLRGREDLLAWWSGPGIGCRGSRLLATTANGRPAFGQYRSSPDGGHDPWALQVLDISRGRLAGITYFLETASLFPLFGLPPRLDAD